MDKPNTRKVALVTGASSGIGEAAAHRLLEKGFAVYAAARRLERMENLASRGARTVRMDIAQASDIEHLISIIENEHGRVDVLVNNAGFGSYGAVEDVPLEEARYQFEVNLFGLARLTQLVLPCMRAQKSGRIINISSVGGRIFTPLGAWYHATKHALEGWSDCLRIETAPFGIHVVVVQPGLIKTEFGDVVRGLLEKRSGNSAYAPMATRMLELLNEAVEKGKGSSPEGIADVIMRAALAKKPRTRYSSGDKAKFVLFVRRWVSDRMFDRIILNARP